MDEDLAEGESHRNTRPIADNPKINATQLTVPVIKELVYLHNTNMKYTTNAHAREVITPRGNLLAFGKGIIPLTEIKRGKKVVTPANNPQAVPR